MVKTYLFEHGAVGGDLGVIEVPLSAEQVAIVEDTRFDYVTPAAIVHCRHSGLEEKPIGRSST